MTLTIISFGFIKLRSIFNYQLKHYFRNQEVFKAMPESATVNVSCKVDKWSKPSSRNDSFITNYQAGYQEIMGFCLC